MISNPNKILIIRLSAIGDVLRALPVLRTIRQNFPGSRIAWAVEEASKDLLFNHPDVDEVIVVPLAAWRSMVKSGRLLKATAEAAAFIKNLKARQFDLTIDFHGLLKSGLISYLSGAPVRVSFTREFTKEFNCLFNNCRFPLETNKISRIERNYMLLQKMGLKIIDDYPAIPITEYDKAAISTFFRQSRIDTSRPLVVMHPGTSPKTLYKRWEPNRYAVVADQLIEDYAAQIIFTWADRELDTVKEITAVMKYRAHVACETRSLGQLAEIFRHCDLYVGGDTGPMHLAAFMKVPVVAIFGPTDYIVNAPYKKTKHIIIRKELACSPCRVQDCKKRDCMKAIHDEDVIQAARLILNAGKNRHDSPQPEVLTNNTW
jgi:lipopolysaccharide heptosyltransferase I